MCILGVGNALTAISAHQVQLPASVNMLKGILVITSMQACTGAAVPIRLFSRVEFIDCLKTCANYMCLPWLQ